MDKLEDGIILYHGSYSAVDRIDLSKCYRGKDFEKGFHLTIFYEQRLDYLTAVYEAEQRNLNK